MTRRDSRASAGLVLAAALLIAGCSGSDSPTEPTPPPAPNPSPAVAGFTVVDGGGERTVSYTEGPNRVFCSRNAGWADLWVRMAEVRAGNGAGGPHVDVDLCRDAQGGSYSPLNPQAAQCSGARAFVLWWHDGAGGTFANAPQAADCVLTLTASGNQREADFHCRGLVEQGGERTVDILDGYFRCTVE